jgi:superfamily I DNA/RNA helicase
MHRSKGLEFAAVGIVDLNDGLIPLRRALEDAADPAIRRGVVDASKSLLHVSATRAKKRLFVSSSGVPSDLISHLKATVTAE